MTFSEKTFTTPVIVTGIFPVNKWERQGDKNVDTGVREGTRVDALFKANSFDQDKVGVKIDSINLPLSEGQIKESRANDSPIYVLFENLSIRPYNHKDTPKVMSYSGTATGLTVVTDTDAPASTPNPAQPKSQPAPKSTRA